MAILLPPPRRRPEDSNMPVPIQSPAGVGAGIGAGIMQGMKDSRRDAATASLAKPMDQLRTEAYGGAGFSGPLPGGQRAPVRSPAMLAGGAPAARAFNAPVQNQLGTMSFKNLQPRNTMPGLPSPSMTASAGGAMPTQESSAGFTPYAEEQIGGAPRRISGMRGSRAGARYTEGPMRGKTQDQALLKARDQYGKLSSDQKAAYESKARKEDISTTIPGMATPALTSGDAPEPPQRMSIDGAELAPIRPGLIPNMPKGAPMPPMVRKKQARLPGDSMSDGDEDD